MPFLRSNRLGVTCIKYDLSLLTTKPLHALLVDVERLHDVLYYLPLFGVQLTK